MTKIMGAHIELRLKDVADLPEVLEAFQKLVESNNIDPAIVVTFDGDTESYEFIKGAKNEDD